MVFNKLSEYMEDLHTKYPAKCGQFWALLLSITVSGFAISVKFLKERHPVPYSNYYCGLIVWISGYLLAQVYGVPLFKSDKPEIQFKLFLRAILGAAFFSSVTIAASLIPIQLLGVLMGTNVLWG